MKDRIIIALDVDILYANRLIKDFGELVNFYKVGIALYTDGNPNLVPWLHSKGKKVFLDLKFHDIPNTVEKACKAAARLKADFLTIHLCGGKSMIEAAKNGVAGTKTKILGVSVLTSTSESDLEIMGIRYSFTDYFDFLVGLGVDCGIDGVVCSPQETAKVRRAYSDLLIVNPGVRCTDDLSNDQLRFNTPEFAITSGANHIVVGRSIIDSRDPIKKLEKIHESIGNCSTTI